MRRNIIEGRPAPSLDNPTSSSCRKTCRSHPPNFWSNQNGLETETEEEPRLVRMETANVLHALLPWCCLINVLWCQYNNTTMISVCGGWHCYAVWDEKSSNDEKQIFNLSSALHNGVNNTGYQQWAHLLPEVFRPKQVFPTQLHYQWRKNVCNHDNIHMYLNELHWWYYWRIACMLYNLILSPNQ